MTIGGYLHEFRGDSHAIADAHDGSLYNSIHVQFIRNLRKGFMGPFVGHRCGPGYYPQRADFDQIRDQVIGHTVSEVVLFLVPRKIFERQNHKRTAQNRFPLAGVHTTDIVHSNSGNQCASRQHRSHQYGNSRKSEVNFSLAFDDFP